MAINIEDLRAGARRRLPRAVFDYVDGGAEDEQALGENRAAFGRLTFCPRVLVDVSRRDQSTTVLGERISSPVLLAPTGLAGLVWPRGEIAAARAAARTGTIYVMATRSTCSVEEVAVAAAGPRWLQVYVWRDRQVTRRLIERARAAGYRALCLTVDVAVSGHRERDLRNGFTIPPRVTLSNAVDTLRRASYLRGILRGPKITDKNFLDFAPGVGTDLVSLGGYVSGLQDPTVNWDDLDWFKSLWPGPLAIKGIMTPEDARRAVDHGAEAIVVSNHGGRQLDSLPSAIDALPEIVDGVDGRAEILLDGGLRRGSDVVKAIALGARAGLVGRPFLYGLAAAGQAGVERALEILRDEIDRTLALIGRPTLAELDRTAIRRFDRRPP
jgi:L-lactate dehydrogenase (cytochrome)